MRKINIANRGASGWATGEFDELRCFDLHATAKPTIPPPSQPTVIWSGGLGEHPFVPDPRSWLAEGWEALADALNNLPDGTLLRPHWAHVISDAPSARQLHSAFDNSNIGLALSPASMISPEMTVDVSDHMDRIFEFAGQASNCVVLEDLDLATLRPVEAGHGDLNGHRLGHLIANCMGNEQPLVVLATDDQAARDWLGW